MGCGFGGLEAAKAFSGKDVSITVVDRQNHHVFQPLLYQVATAGLSATAVAAPIRRIFAKQRNVTILMATVTAIDPIAKTVALDGGGAVAGGQSLEFDHLIVAAGATHSYFGHDGWEEHALGLKTLADAQAIRARLLTAYERAEALPPGAGQSERDALLTTVVIGAGPTGVEMAGTMAEIARHTLTGEFRNFSPEAARVILIEGGERVLAAFTPKQSDQALHQLSRLGVEVMLGSQVKGIDAQGVDVQQKGRLLRIDAATVVWAAGVQASPLARVLADRCGVGVDRAGRLLVEGDLSLKGHACISVVGDMAAIVRAGKGGGAGFVPGVSPAAKQAGRAAARNVWRRLVGEPTVAFAYNDYGNLATIGRKAAVVDLPVGRRANLRFSGFLAWLFWLFVHVYFLIGFRNRLVVMLGWAWAYVTFERGARIVGSPDVRSAKP